MKEVAAVNVSIPFTLHVHPNPEKAKPARQTSTPVLAEVNSQIELRSVYQPKPVQNEVSVTHYVSATAIRSSKLQCEPEDAHLTGAKRSLQRRLLGLNLASQQSALSRTFSLAKRA
ncbi:MAG: hypothetical protein ACYC0Z_09215 [Acidobacteriaceae bacterium]